MLSATTMNIASFEAWEADGASHCRCLRLLACCGAAAAAPVAVLWPEMAARQRRSAAAPSMLAPCAPLDPYPSPTHLRPYVSVPMPVRIPVRGPAGIRRDHQLIARNVHELLVAGALALWPPLLMAGLGGAVLTARTFFAW